jgi:transposase
MVKVKQKVNFKGKTVQVGMDVHHKQWNISIFLEGQLVRRFQQPPLVEAIVKHLKEQYPGARYLLAYEAGFCGFWISRKFKELGMECIVVNASDVPQTNKDLTQKNDPNDSRRIGEALSANMLRPINIPDIELESDRMLVRYRMRLQRDMNRSQVRIKSLLHQSGIIIPGSFAKGTWSNVFIQWLREIKIEQPSAKATLEFMIDQVLLLRAKLLEVMRSIRTLSKKSRYQKNYGILTSVPGIGPIVATTLLTEVGDINRFKNFYHFNSFIGFCPTEYSSGENERHGSMTRRHHSPLRELLIEATWVAISNDPSLTLAYQKLKVKVGGKRAIVKMARKLLNRIFTVWRNSEPYVKGLV